MYDYHHEILRELIRFHENTLKYHKMKEIMEEHRQKETPTPENNHNCCESAPESSQINAAAVVEPLEFHILKTRIEFFYQLLIGMLNDDTLIVDLADIIDVYEHTFAEVLDELSPA